MADDSVINAYIERVRRALGSYRYGERAVAELADHLQQRVDALTEAGCSRQDACSAAINALGDPDLYVADFSSVRAMPTTFTRWAGLAGLCGAPLLGLGFAQPSEGNQVPWLLIIPFAAFVVGLLGVIVRTRGSFGRSRGLFSLALIVVGGSVGLAGGYGLVGFVCAAAVLLGLSLLLHATYRVGALPQPATLTVAVAGVALVALIGSDLEEESLPVYAAGAALFVGWCWLQYTLWSESPCRVGKIKS